MKLLYMNNLDPSEGGGSAVPPVPGDPTAPEPPRPKWYDILLEQMVNSAIVGGIAGISALGWETGLKAFGLAFLIEMRKYRKL